MVKPTHWLVVYAGLPLNLRTYDPILMFRGSSHGFLLANLVRRVKGLMYTIILIRSQVYYYWNYCYCDISSIRLPCLFSFQF